MLLDVETAGVHTVKGFATIDDVALINVEVRFPISQLHLVMTQIAECSSVP